MISSEPYPDRGTSAAASVLESSIAACDRAAWQARGWAERAQLYLRDRSPGEMADDMTALARRRPGATLLAAAVLGLLVGRGLRGLARH